MIPTPGFAEKIEELQRAGRYRTAIQESLKIIDHDPGNQEALLLAAHILSLPRTLQLAATEPLTEALECDRRLNPVWAVCQKCETSWVPNALHLGPFGGDLLILNPTGLQCSSCGYTLCHVCLTETPFGVATSVCSQPCPEGCGVELSVPVRPTGRKNLQMGRRPQRVTHVFLFREGPIQPDTPYVRAFLELRSPDVFESRPQIHAVPMGKWPEHVDFHVIAFLLASGVTQDMVLNSECGTILDDHDSRVHIVKIYAAK